MRVVNLCFHGIGRPQRDLEPGEDAYWVTDEMFHRALDEVLDRPEAQISFDDGNASDVETGLPALLERGLRATFFVLAGRLDQPGSLSTEAVRALVDAGMTIGTHGMDHLPWRGLTDQVLDRELVEARSRLQQVVGSPVDQAAVPLGRYDRRLLADLRRLGYASVHTSDRRWATAGGWMQPRFSIRSDDTAESLRGNVFTPQGWQVRLRGSAVGVVKRLR